MVESLKADIPLLSNDGERFLPEQMHGSIELEHLHRYLFARQHVGGKDVLDIASGEGYGSELLARVARSVIGVDIASEAVEHAKLKYIRENLEYRKGSCSAIPLENNSVDIVVSFETIEHHTEHEEMMLEVKRVLRKGGILIISSPDKLEYSDRPSFTNHFHVKELYRDEFQSLLESHFFNVKLYSQRVMLGSVLHSLQDARNIVFEQVGRDSSPTSEMPNPMYWVALASDKKLPKSSSGIFEQSLDDLWRDISRQRNQTISELIAVVAQPDSTLLKAQFSGLWYQQQNPDLIRAGVDPYQHWISNGISEGRLPAAVPVDLAKMLIAEREQSLQQAVAEKERELCQVQQETQERQRELDATIVQTKLKARDEIEAQLRALVERERSFGDQLAQLHESASQQRIAEQETARREMEALIEQHTQREQSLLQAMAEKERELRRVQQETQERQRELDATIAQTKLKARYEVGALLRALAERERSFGDQLAQLHESASQQRIAEQETARREMEALIEQHTQREQSLLQAMAEKERELRRVQQETQERQRELDATIEQTKLKARYEVGAQLRTLAERERSFADHLAQLHESASQQRIAEQETARREMEALIEQHTQREQSLLQAMAEKERELTLMLQESKASQNEISKRMLDLEKAANQELLELKIKYNGLVNDIHFKLISMQSTWSWRITRPFRRINDILSTNPDCKPIAMSFNLELPIGLSDKIKTENNQANIYTHRGFINSQAERQEMQYNNSNLNQITNAKTLNELIRHDGDVFVKCAYITLVGRYPDPQGFDYYIDRLNDSGDKLAILNQIYRSDEAKRFNAKVEGLDKAMTRQNWKSYPLIGWVLRMVDCGVGESRILHKLNCFSDRIEDLEENILKKIEAVKNNQRVEDREEFRKYVLDLFQSFDANFYFENNIDVAVSGMNAYEHWVVAGFAEGRLFKRVNNGVKDVEKVGSPSFLPSMKKADGVWEWADYNTVKSRIENIKSRRRLEYTSRPLEIINISELDFDKVISKIEFCKKEGVPDVSIVIPVFNNIKITLECLLSISENTDDGISYEVIVADDSSNPETSNLLSSIKNIKYFRNNENLGFLRNCNVALQYCSGKYVVFLNNDVQVTPNWLVALYSTFDEHPDAGAVGPRFLYPNGYLQEAGAAFRENGTSEMIGLNEDPSQPRYSYTRRVDYVSGACLMMKTELARLLEGFSEKYLPCYCEDSDLCLRIQESGYYVYVNPDSTIVHHLSKTTGNIDSEFKWRSVTKNLAVLSERWLPYFSSVRPKIIAFYLPQFHPFPENDKWWGAGFTEWSNVTKAYPNFVGHLQPKLPAELGFYDLRVPEIMQKQAELARRYGVGGFCFYYYWFGGKRLMELPIEQMLESGKPDFPFCLCWANENWTRRWDGQENDVLIAQAHSEADDVNVISDLIRYFKDERYIRIDGRPLLLVYRVTLFPDFLETSKTWRRICREQGIGEIYISMVESFELVHKNVNPNEYGCDAAVEFPPQELAEPKSPSGEVVNPEFAGHVADYRDLAVRYVTRDQPAYTRFKGVMPGWDNTARRQNNSFCFEYATPGAFQAWLEEALDQTRLQNYGDERLVFVNAWNEWAEGAYLEPDRVFGHSYLEAVRNALDAPILLNKD